MATNRFSSKFKKTKIGLSSISLSQGRLKSMTSTPQRHIAQRASENLNVRGIMPDVLLGASTGRIAFDMMHAIGYTIEVGEENETLLAFDGLMSHHEYSEGLIYKVFEDSWPLDIMSQTGLIYKAFEDSWPLDIMASFPNTHDPIYQMDDNLPTSLQSSTLYISRKMAETLDLVTSVATLGTHGLSPSRVGQTSRYFNNTEVAAAARGLKR